MEIIKGKGEIVIKQQNYVKCILEKYSMQDCKPRSTPLDRDVKLEKYNDSKPCDQKLYQEMLGSLMFLATRTRPDIACAVTLLSKYTRDPRNIHLTALKGVLRYLNGTQSTGLRFTPDRLDVKGLSDASWRNPPEKSITGYVYSIGKNILSWTSKQQLVTPLSTCDAELYALGSCAKKGIWVKFFLEELFGKLGIIQLLCDNQSAISIAKSGYTSNNSNHLIRLA
ncbi:uncharacterized protein [Centruroides vittatus]|uniref:uncharacterized protein n=1 Tax=Centruroides vittatus TaxID=120091 RepID=UPI003510CDAF